MQWPLMRDNGHFAKWPFEITIGTLNRVIVQPYPLWCRTPALLVILCYQMPNPVPKNSEEYRKMISGQGFSNSSEKSKEL
jgi:hypothetical protein